MALMAGKEGLSRLLKVHIEPGPEIQATIDFNIYHNAPFAIGRPIHELKKKSNLQLQITSFNAKSNGVFEHANQKETVADGFDGRDADRDSSHVT